MRRLTTLGTSLAPSHFTCSIQLTPVCRHSINLGAQIVTLGLSLFGIGYCLYENRLRRRGGRDYRLEGLRDREIQDLGYRYVFARQCL